MTPIKIKTLKRKKTYSWLSRFYNLTKETGTLSPLSGWKSNMVLKIVCMEFCRISINFIVKGMCDVGNLLFRYWHKQRFILQGEDFLISSVFYLSWCVTSISKYQRCFLKRSGFFLRNSFSLTPQHFIKGTPKLCFCGSQVNRFTKIDFKKLKQITIFVKSLVHKLLTATILEVARVNLYHFNCL